MEISIKVLTGSGCKCCDNLEPKIKNVCSRNGYSLEFTDVGNVKDLPLDLTGVPYIIMTVDGRYGNSWQGDMCEELIEAKIDATIDRYKRIKQREESELK